MGSITPSIYGLVSTLKLQSWNNSQKLQARQNIGCEIFRTDGTQGFQRFSITDENGQFLRFDVSSTGLADSYPSLNMTFGAEEGFRVEQGTSYIDVRNSLGTRISGLLSFVDTTTPGLRLKSLTTAQYNALTPANGDLYRDSTTDRIDARLARGTVELVDTAGGQTIGGDLKVTSLLDLRKTGTANLLQFATNGFLRTDTSQLMLYNAGTGMGTISFNRAGTSLALASNISLAFTSGTEAGGGTLDTHLSQASAGVLRIGTTAANALGSLNLTNLTASGTVTASTFVPPASMTSLGVNCFISGNVALATGTLLTFSSTADPNGLRDWSISRASAGVAQVGNGTANALGSLNLTNLTASGTITVTGTYLYGDTTTPFVRLSNANGARIGYTGGNSINCGGPVTILDSAGNERVRFQTGNSWMGVNVNSPLAPVHSVASLTTSPAIIAQGAASQTASVFEVRNSAAAVVASITDTGNVTASGTISTLLLTLTSAANNTLRSNSGFLEVRNAANSALAGLNASTLNCPIVQLGSGGPAFRASGGTIQARDAANATDAPFTCSNLTASGSVFAAGSSNVYSFSSTHPVSTAPSTSWRFGSGWAGNYDTQFIFAYADNAAKVLIDTSGAITAFGGYYVNVPAGSSNNIRPLQHGNSFLRFSAPASGIPGNNTTVEGWDSVILNASTGNVRLRIGNVDRLVLTNTDLTLTGSLTASGTLRVGGGTVVASILSATATLDFPSILTNDTHTLTITVTGAVAGDSVFLGVPAGLDAGLIFCASVTAANTVTIRMHNSSGGSVDPASGTFRATVIRF